MVERNKTPHYECGGWGLAFGRLRLNSLSGNTRSPQAMLERTMTLCMVYNTTGEPVELVSTLMGLRLHLLGKAVVLGTIPGRVARSARLVFPLPASVVLRKHRRLSSAWRR